MDTVVAREQSDKSGRRQFLQAAAAVGAAFVAPELTGPAGQEATGATIPVEAMPPDRNLGGAEDATEELYVIETTSSDGRRVLSNITTLAGAEAFASGYCLLAGPIRLFRIEWKVADTVPVREFPAWNPLTDPRFLEMLGAEVPPKAKRKG